MKQIKCPKCKATILAVQDLGDRKEYYCVICNILVHTEYLR